MRTLLYSKLHSLDVKSSPADAWLALAPARPASFEHRYGELTPQKLAGYEHVFLQLHDAAEETIHSALAPYIPTAAFTAIKGLLVSFISTRADLQRLHTILSAVEAKFGLAAGRLQLVIEFGHHVEPLLAPQLLKGLSNRLTAIVWNEQALRTTLGASHSRAENGALLPPFAHAQTICLMQARAAGVLALDSPSQHDAPFDQILKDAKTAQQMGFDGKAFVSQAQRQAFLKG
ncbi:aldolase/citrate lyase family protein [Polycladidibacter hongkongensis]|uniref:aldolase/citrate lyase family protein n=1 Tax=Polycladidibacter hongkongensis TaxID=1647556 RepID=UPI00082B72D7|nr:aldolase/citrate lyase family protein [Pseudovibrio hongkongensis]